MDKIQKAQELADQLLDECNTVGDNKGALNDEPESIKKSEEDLEDYVKMEESLDLLDEDFATQRKEENWKKSHEAKKNTWGEKHGGNVRNFDNGYGKTGGDFKTLKLKNTVLGYRKQDRKDAQDKIMKQWKKKHIKEADQVATAQQKDTLFDKLERVVKDSDKLKPTITQEPTLETTGAQFQLGKKRNDLHLKLGYSMDPKAKANAKKRKEKIGEGWLAALQKKGKEIMKGKRKKGLKLTEPKDKAMKKVMKG